MNLKVRKKGAGAFVFSGALLCVARGWENCSRYISIAALTIFTPIDVLLEKETGSERWSTNISYHMVAVEKM